MIKQIVNSEDCIHNCDDPCCRFYEQKYAPKFTEEEYDNVAMDEEVKKVMIKISKNMWQPKLSEKDGPYFLCPFVKNNTSCGIYEKRPFDCKIWPFFVIKRGGDYFLALDDEECYCLEKLKNTIEMKNHILQIAETVQKEHFVEIFKKYPELIWEHDETFKILCPLNVLKEKIK
jgi:Fe-S-cluster containining protein